MLSEKNEKTEKSEKSIRLERSETVREIKERMAKAVGGMKIGIYEKVKTIEREKPWSDSVFAQEKVNDNAQNIKITDEVDSYISSRLAHIVVNPTKRRDETDVLIKTYVYSDNINAINHSEETVRKFVSELCDISIKNRSAIKDKNNKYGGTQYISSSKIIVGERGCGKTFFLNHILSKYSEYLDERKVIWVRINTVDTFLTSKANYLLHWMYAQATKLVMRYYSIDAPLRNSSDKKMPIDITAYLNNYIDRVNNKELRVQLAMQLQGMLDVFRNPLCDDPLSEEIVPLILAREVWNCAIENGYSFIVVFDGFDRLELTDHAGRKHMQLLDNLMSIISPNNQYPACFVAACRKSTLDIISQEDQQNTFFRKQTEPLFIGNVDFKDVFNKRIDYLDMIISDDKTIGDVSDEKKKNLKGFRDLINEEIDGYDMFDKNIRASMQAAQLRYKEYIAYELHKKQYRWIESFMKMGLKYPPRPYSYRYTEDKVMPYSPYLTQEKIIDNRLLVSLYLFPYFGYEDNPIIIPEIKNILLGLRVLQLMGAAEDMRKNDIIRDYITVGMICEILLVCFGYPGKIVRALLREYVEFEMVEPLKHHVTKSALPQDSESLVLTKKSKYILSECLCDVAYLSMCAMRLPINKEYLTFENGNPLFFAETFAYSREENNITANLSSWVAAKIINSINLYNILSLLDNEQIKVLRQNTVKIGNRLQGKQQSLKYNMYKHFYNNIRRIDSYRETIVRQLSLIIDSIQDIVSIKDLENILEHIKNNKYVS